MKPAQMIKSLIRAGYTESDIADIVGVDQSTINRLKNGKHNTIQYAPGTRLAVLYRQLKRNP